MKRKAIIVVAIIALSLGGICLYNYMNKERDPMIQKLKQTLSKVNPSFMGLDIRTGTSAYTENKTTIYMCMKDPETGQYYSMNTLVYVALHEISHVLNRKSYGHDQNFKDVFSDLLKKAEAVGIYDPRQPIPNSYCGVEHFTRM